MAREPARTLSLDRSDDDGESIARWLVVEGTPGTRLQLPEGRVLVGRSPECDLVLDDPCVSDRHFAVAVEDGQAVLQDLGSRNGTWINGLRIRSSTLAPGVRIDVGRTRLRCAAEPSRAAPRILGGSRRLREALIRIDRYAPLEGPALIRGESGTGKELAARALHEGSRRRRGPFVAVNCAGFSPDLVDSELFGHERGAFTGAVERRRGAFELAHRGTLFLDELGELPLPQQAKLLRVLESREVRRVGGEEITRLDVRLVAATNADLEGDVRRGAFRSDLYHRLAVLEIRMPPLRARLGDLPLLARAILDELSGELGPRRLSGAALDRLSQHAWPGNIRELRNVLYRAAAGSAAAVIEPADLDLAAPSDGPTGLAAVPRAERHVAVLAALQRHRGNLTAAARSLGIARSTLRGWAAQARAASRAESG